MYRKGKQNNKKKENYYVTLYETSSNKQNCDELLAKNQRSSGRSELSAKIVKVSEANQKED